MSELLAGLIGVVAGGLVTGAVQVFQTWQGRRLQRRVAARLIAGDLTRSLRVTELILEYDRWPNTALTFDTEIADWRAQREAFAAAVSTYDWHMVASVYDHLAVLAATAEQHKPLTASDRTEIAQTKRRLDIALEVAGAHTGSKRDQQRFMEKWEEKASGGA